ncbi:MAG: hypothetical protein RIA08_15920 [Roseovarius sp.]|uniref:hypothetical protein n=1 Tax=Roseobacteraceae TaxID=2854170 RepID=UPI0032EE6B8F
MVWFVILGSAGVPGLVCLWAARRGAGRWVLAMAGAYLALILLGLSRAEQADGLAWGMAGLLILGPGLIGALVGGGIGWIVRRRMAER